MRRILSEHFKLNGQPKRSFDTRRQAVAFLTDRNLLATQHPYLCYCGKWHLAKDR